MCGSWPCRMEKCSYCQTDIDRAQNSGLIKPLLIKIHKSLLKRTKHESTQLREPAKTGNVCMFVHLFRYLLVCLFVLVKVGAKFENECFFCCAFKYFSRQLRIVK